MSKSFKVHHNFVGPLFFSETMNPVLSEELTLPQRCAAFFFLSQWLVPPKRSFVYILLFIGRLALRLPLLLLFNCAELFFHQLILEGILRHVEVS